MASQSARPILHNLPMHQNHRPDTTHGGKCIRPTFTPQAHGSYGPHESAPQTAPRLVQPYLQGSQTWPTDTHTQTQADYTTPCVVIRTDYDKCDICSNRLHLMHWVYVMWPNYWQNSWKLHVHNITNRTSKTKKTAVLTINTVNTLSPSELCVPVADVAGHRQLRSTSRGLLYFPCYNMSNYGRCAFSYADPHALNLLAENVRKWKCIAIFKRSLKMFLFEQITHSEH